MRAQDKLKVARDMAVMYLSDDIVAAKFVGNMILTLLKNSRSLYDRRGKTFTMLLEGLVQLSSLAELFRTTLIAKTGHKIKKIDAYEKENR